MLVAFQGDQAIKEKYLSREKRMYELAADPRAWVESERKLSVGNIIEVSDPSAFENEVGIPADVAFLQQQIFEGLPLKNAQSWAKEFLSAIRPGANLSAVCSQFAAWLLEDPKYGVVNWNNTQSAENTIRHVAKLLRDGCTDVNEWHKASTMLAIESALANMESQQASQVQAKWALDLASCNSNAAALMAEARGRTRESEKEYGEAKVAREKVNKSYHEARRFWLMAAANGVAIAVVAGAVGSGPMWAAQAAHWAALADDSYIRQSQKLLELLSAAQ